MLKIMYRKTTLVRWLMSKWRQLNTTSDSENQNFLAFFYFNDHFQEKYEYVYYSEVLWKKVDNPKYKSFDEGRGQRSDLDEYKTVINRLVSKDQFVQQKLDRLD